MCRCLAEPYFGDPIPDGGYADLPDAIAEAEVWQARPVREYDTSPENWRLGKYSKKTTAKWARQIRERGWTEEKISRTIAEGIRYPATNKTNRPHTDATRYQLGDKYLVIDNRSRNVVQLGAAGFEPND